MRCSGLTRAATPTCTCKSLADGAWFLLKSRAVAPSRRPSATSKTSNDAQIVADDAVPNPVPSHKMIPIVADDSTVMELHYILDARPAQYSRT